MSTDIDKTPDPADEEAVVVPAFADWAKIARAEVTQALREVERAEKKIADGRYELARARARLAIAERADSAVKVINRPTTSRPRRPKKETTK